MVDQLPLCVACPLLLLVATRRVINLTTRHLSEEGEDNARTGDDGPASSFATERDMPYRAITFNGFEPIDNRAWAVHGQNTFGHLSTAVAAYAVDSSVATTSAVERALAVDEYDWYNAAGCCGEYGQQVMVMVPMLVEGMVPSYYPGCVAWPVDPVPRWPYQDRQRALCTWCARRGCQEECTAPGCFRKQQYLPCPVDCRCEKVERTPKRSRRPSNSVDNVSSCYFVRE